MKNMKFSIFNSIIPLTDKSVLIYNSFTDSFLIVNSNVKNVLQVPGIVKEQELELYRKLIKFGCYIFDNQDEFLQLKNVSKIITDNEKRFFLMLNPTLDCNFNCWYCYENHIKYSKMNADVMDRIFLLLFKTISNNIMHFTLSFFGGEPLMYYKEVILPFIKYAAGLCKEKGIRFDVSFTSNGSLIKDSMISEICKYAFAGFQITLDGGRKEHNGVRFFANHNGSYDVIIKNVKILLMYKCEVCLRINYTKENVYSIFQIANDLKEISTIVKSLLKIDLHRVWQDKDSMVILPEIKEVVDYFIALNFTVEYNSLNEIRNSCYGDKRNTAIVNYNGDVYKCSAEDFSTENRDGYLDENGDVIWIKSQDFRFSVKLKNRFCHTCRIAPLCGGGCTKYILQQIKENREYCLFNHDQIAINDLILDRLEKILRIKQ